MAAINRRVFIGLLRLMVESSGAQQHRAVVAIRVTVKAPPIRAAGINPPGSMAVVFSGQPGKCGLLQSRQAG